MNTVSIQQLNMSTVKVRFSPRQLTATLFHVGAVLRIKSDLNNYR